MRHSANYVHINTDQPLVIAEVGVRDGGNASAILKEMRVERLYLVDNYLPYLDSPSSTFFTQELQDSYYIQMFNKVKDYLDKAVLISKESTFAAKLFSDNFFDYVYIDACHVYESVKADINAWWPKVKASGVMGGHDADISGVKEAVDEFVKLNHLQLIPNANGDWLIQKRKE